MQRFLLSTIMGVSFVVSFILMASSSCESQISPNAASHEPDARSEGAKGLLITYRCAPANRPALREYVSQTEIPKLDGLQKSGILASKKVLFSRYVDTANWDLLIFLEFGSTEQLAKWTQLERTAPAGFDTQGLKLVTDISTYPIDLVGTQSAPVKASKPVYLVVPYDYTVSTDAYLQYLQGYVFPQTSGWIGAGTLASYNMYVGRGAVGRPWSSMLVLEYRDDDAFGRRDATIATVRAKLKNDPTWKAISDNKQSVRIEKAPILADEMK